MQLDSCESEQLCCVWRSSRSIRYSSDCLKLFCTQSSAFDIARVPWVQRSKALNVLNAPVSKTVSHSRPSSASYLIPAVTDDHNGSSLVHPSEQDPCNSNRLTTKAAEQNGSADLDAHPKAIAQTTLAQTASDQTADGASERQPAPARHAETAGIKLSAAMPTASLDDEQRSAGPSRAHTSQLAGIPSMDLPPASPSTSHKGTVAPQIQPCAERQQRLPAPLQHGFMTAWPQNNLSLKAPEHWSPMTSAHAVNRDQGKIGCAHSFPFSKQPCAVMW